MWVTRGMFAQAGPADDFWYGPVQMSASGALVSADSALKLSVVFACVRVKSEAVAKIPLRIMSGNDVVRDHPLSRLLARKPNRWQTSFEWREMMQTHLELRGNAFSQKYFGRDGGVVELVPMHPDRMETEDMPGGDWRYKYTDQQGNKRTLMRYEVLHLKQLSTDGRMGTSTIGAQREGIGAALSAQDYSGRLWKNGAKHSGMWIEMPGKFADKTAREHFTEGWRKSQSGGNAGSTPVMDQGMKIHELGMNNADAQFIESRKYSDSDLCRMFLVPPHKVGILDRATFSNIEQQSSEFYNDTMMGVFRRWEELLETELLTDVEQDTLQMKFDIAELLRADTAGRSKLYHDAILDGWMTRNEARMREGMGPLPGLDEPLEPLNMGRAGDAASPQDVPAASKERALLVAAADRAVTREVNAVARMFVQGTIPHVAEAVTDWYGAHAAFCRDALMLTDDQAAGLCAARIKELGENDVSATLARWKSGGGALLLEYL